MMPELIEPKNDADIRDVGVMLNTGNNGRISVRFGSPRVLGKDALELYYDGELDADGRQTKYDEIETKLKKLGWSPLKIHVESYQGNEMTFNKLPLNLSEETQYKLAKILYTEDGEGGIVGSNSLTSASNLGPLPKVVFGGAGIGFETQRRRNKVQSEESCDDDNVIDRFLERFREWYPFYEDDATAPFSDNDNNPAPKPKPDDATTEEPETLLESIKYWYGDKNEAEDNKSHESSYIVSWADPRIIGKLHKEQQRLGNGLSYVTFGGLDKATKFYKDLNIQGVYNVKMDRLG